MPFSILIIDDEIEMCLSLAEFFNSAGYSAFYADKIAEAEAIISAKPISLILMDVRMPEMNGISLLKKIRSEENIPVIMISGYASVENIVEAMKYGATDFYEKPLKLGKLLNTIKKIEEAENHTGCGDPSHPIITRNPEMLRIIEVISKTAGTDAPVIIMGESGTGKELVANAIHYNSSRRNGTFIKLNSAAIPETLLESELFGHEKGAFTDAKERRIGKLEQANGGSIFFDEIGDMRINTQVKLLRVLQEKSFERIGGSVTIHSDARVIAATHRNINRMIEESGFRSDLYYRLSVITIEIPPLRERREDIMYLSEAFLKDFNKRYNKPITGFSPDVERIFTSHSWPGNVRELKNCVERSVIFCECGTITPGDLPSQYSQMYQMPVSSECSDINGIVEQFSREAIIDALERAGGKKQKAADILNIHRKTLYNRMKKLGIG